MHGYNHEDQDCCVGSCKPLCNYLYFFQNNTTILILYNEFYSDLLHVSAVSFSHHQKGVLVHTENKNGENFLQTLVTFGFPEEGTLVLKNVGILCVMYDYWGTGGGRSWLRHCATNRKGVGSIPDSVIGIFH